MKITVRMRGKKFVLPIGLDIRLIYIDRDVEDSNLKSMICAFKWKRNRVSKIAIIYSRSHLKLRVSHKYVLIKINKTFSILNNLCWSCKNCFVNHPLVMYCRYAYFKMIQKSLSE